MFKNLNGSFLGKKGDFLVEKVDRLSDNLNPSKSLRKTELVLLLLP